MGACVDGVDGGWDGGWERMDSFGVRGVRLFLRCDGEGHRGGCGAMVRTRSLISPWMVGS